MITRKGEYYQETQECLLNDGNFVAKSGKHSLESGDIAWEASTLPLSYTRSNRVYFNPKICGCKEEDWAASIIPILSSLLIKIGPEVRS